PQWKRRSGACSRADPPGARIPRPRRADSATDALPALRKGRPMNLQRRRLVHGRRTSALAAVIVALATVNAAAAPSGRAAAASAVDDPGGYRPVCDTPPGPGWMTCLSLVRTDAAGHPYTASPNTAPAGYGPADLRSAYGLSSVGSSNSTIAIVDAYDDPNAENDLATYRSQFGLTPCTTANGCFRKVNQTGGTSYPTGNAGWAGEISLDLDMASAVCPNCHILL